MNAVSELIQALIDHGMTAADAAILVARAGAEMNARGPSNGALRTRRWRERKASPNVTERHGTSPSQSVTNRHGTSPSQSVTNRHGTSRNVTVTKRHKPSRNVTCDGRAYRYFFLK